MKDRPDERPPLLDLFYFNLIVPLGFLSGENWVAFLGESELQQSHATQHMVHAGCFTISIIDRTMTWTTGL